MNWPHSELEWHHHSKEAQQPPLILKSYLNLLDMDFYLSYLIKPDFFFHQDQDC